METKKVGDGQEAERREVELGSGRWAEKVERSED